MSYYYQRIIPNEVIHEIEKLILEGKTYREIKEIHKVSDGTITRIKQGKIKSNRNIEDRIDLVPLEEVSEIKRELQEARKALLESHQINNLQKMEIEKNKNNAKAEINIFNELDYLSWNENNYKKFIKTNFGKKIDNMYKNKINKLKQELSDTQGQLQTANSHLKRIGSFNRDLNNFPSKIDLDEV